MTDLSRSGAEAVLDTLEVDARAAGYNHRVMSIVGGSIGNLIEWYDWYVYSAFSLYFAKSFFPNGSLTAQLLNIAGVFALGFLMRPIGSWVLGRYADRKGRRTALTASVTLMCLGSLMIALTPGYAVIGMAAPVILVLARLLQGFSVGGEYGTSATYLSEVATRGSRGFYSSFQYVTLIMGQLVALGVLLLLQRVLLTEAQLETWGWRIPFVIGACGAVLAAWLRSGISETAAFRSAQRRKPVGNPLRTLVRHWRAVLIAVGLGIGGAVALYTYSIYMQKFLVNTSGLSRADSTLVSAATLIVFIVLQPLFGGLSDRVGRRPFMLAFSLLGTAFTVPLLTWISSTDSAWTAFLLIVAGLIIVSCYTSVKAVVLSELFPTEVRALGSGLSHAVTASVFGGTAEYAALWFKSAGQEAWFYWYVTFCIALTIPVSLLMRETRTHSEIET